MAGVAWGSGRACAWLRGLCALGASGADGVAYRRSHWRHIWCGEDAPLLAQLLQVALQIELVANADEVRHEQ